MTFALPHTKPVFKHQPDAVLNQANPVSGQKYVVLDTTKNVRIIDMHIKCDWTIQPSPLELHLTIDGIPHIHTLADPPTDTWYVPYIRGSLPETDQGLTNDASVYAPIRAFIYEGRSIKIEAEITGGTVQNLSARVKWAKME